MKTNMFRDAETVKFIFITFFFFVKIFFGKVFLWSFIDIFLLIVPTLHSIFYFIEKLENLLRYFKLHGIQ